MSEPVRVGVIGGGLMGREVASAFGRWFAITDSEVRPELVAVADLMVIVLFSMVLGAAAGQGLLFPQPPMFPLPMECAPATARWLLVGK